MSHHHHHHHHSSCCCGCLLRPLLKLIFAILAVIAIIIVVLWLIFRPHPVKVTVENAVLSRFQLLNSDTSSDIAFDLALDVSIRNPNKRVAIYYDSIEAVAIYNGYRFGYDGRLPVFYQGHTNTTLIHPRFVGQKVLADPTSVETYRREAGEGWFYVEVKLYTRVRFKTWFVKTDKYTPKFTCDLKLPAPSKGGSGTAAFSPTSCKVKFI